MLLRIAFVLAVVAPMFVGLDIVLGAVAAQRDWRRLEAFLDAQISRLAGLGVALWSVALIVGLAGWAP